MPRSTREDNPVVEANGTRYRWPRRPVAVVCTDGGDPAYLRRYLEEGAMPNVARFITRGFSVVAEGTVPSFTCPNNMSIVTGTPASKHGISGNFYLDTRTGEAVVMTGPELLRGDTILARFAAAGARGNVSFSSECASRCTLAEKGIEHVLDQGKATPGEIISVVRPLDGIEAVLDKASACRLHDLPADREADVVVIASAPVCIGASEAEHDLSGLEGHRLRTHGGVSEAKVPFILSEPLNDAYRLKAGAATLKSYQLFDFALNGTGGS